MKVIDVDVDGFEMFKAIFWLFIGSMYLLDYQVADLNDVVLFITLVLADAATSRAKGYRR
jgi:hypothetical protein